MTNAKLFCKATTVIFLAFAQPIAGLAQTGPITPLQQAEMMDACNGMPVVSAQTTASGQLQVRCGRIAGNGAAGSLGTTGAIAGGLLAFLVIAAAGGGASDGGGGSGGGAASGTN